MKTILVTGANGYIASLVRAYQKDNFNWICMTRKDADLTNPEDVKKFVASQDFDICFHTAANATTAFCNEHPDLVHKINVESTQAIIDCCKEKGAKLIFCSTEQAFNGKENCGPFKEDEPLSAVTVYGQNKIECEELIQKQLDDAIILRFTWMMGLSYPGIKASPSIIKNVMNALISHTPTLFTVNEKRGMTYAKHLATQFDKITELEPGIYHVASKNTMTTYESAKFVAKALGASDELIEEIILPNNERYQDRFRDYRLDSEKLESLGIHFATFEEDVNEILMDFGLCRALIAPIEMATGKQAYFCGKPNPLMMRTGLKRLGCHSAEAVMVGDRMDTDVISGMECGMSTVLVLSGISTEATLDEYAYRPSAVLDGVGDIVTLAEAQHAE